MNGLKGMGLEMALAQRRAEYTDGETLALCTLPSDRFIVVWRAEMKDRATCARIAPPMSQFR